MVGFSLFAVFVFVALKLLGVVVGLFGTLLWFAAIGFFFYLVLRIFAPGLADRVRETFIGKRAA